MNQFYVAPLGGISLAPQLMDMGNRLRDDRKAESDKQAKMQRFAEVKSAMEEAYGSGNPDQMAMVAMNYPEAQKTIEMLAGFQSDKTKKQGLDTYRQVLARKDNPQAAVNALQVRVDYLTENGANPQHTQADLDELRGAIERGEDPTPIFNNMEMAYAGMASTQEWKAYKGDADKSNLGTYNPRDYTTESWSIFTRSGNPDDLERYESQSVIESGGAKFLVDRVTGARTPISSTQEAATGQASIASAVRSAEEVAQADAATDRKFKEQLGSTGANVYTDLQMAAQKASAFIPRLKSLKELSSKVETGTGAEIKLAAKKALGIDSADMEELNAKLGELAQDILNQQTGTKTDFDFQNAVKQAASLGKTKEANTRLIEALVDRQLEAVSFGDMAKEAYDKGGVKAVLDMRFSSPTKPPASKKVSWSDL